MDFSSPKRALTSLLRRNPPLREETLCIVGKLLKERLDEGELSCGILSLIHESDGDRWEPLAVGLLLAAEWLDRQCQALSGEAGSHVYADGPRQPCLTSSMAEEEKDFEVSNILSIGDTFYADCREFCNQIILHVCKDNLEHDEPRVRTLVARVIGSHARYATICEKKLKLVDDGAAILLVSSLKEDRFKVSQYIGASLRAQSSMFDEDRVLPSPDFQAPALDDTTGWRALETSLIALSSWIDGCGEGYMNAYYDRSSEGSILACEGVEFNENLLTILENCSSKHINRHVRAAGLQCLEHIVKISCGELPGTCNIDHVLSEGTHFRKCLVTVLTICLADNWSQVRMAASVLNREFILAVRSVCGMDSLKSLFPTLLPRMCLNRFYLAQGVQLYSKDTWKMIFDCNDTNFPLLSGALEVSKCAGNVCRYYVKMCDADNHVVREAACQAVAEIAERLGSNAEYAPYVEPFVPMLLQALILCFHDESWPVRDEACLACGKFLKAYPEVCLEDLPMLFERWTDHLSDPIWSVREDAAVALGDALEAYSDESIVLKPLLDILNERIPLARKQPAMTKEELIATHNNAELHTNSQLYSCGSLAPKLKKRSHGGCSDCKVNRDRMPWEATDGCIYCLREMCRLYTDKPNSSSTSNKIQINDSILLPLMENIIDVCRLKHFPQADDMRATLWKQLPIMAKHIGKTAFKRRYLHLFIELLMDNVGSSTSSNLSRFAASSCCCELAKLVGEGIFRGRCEEYGAGRIFDSCMQDQGRMQQPFQTGYLAA